MGHSDDEDDESTHEATTAGRDSSDLDVMDGMAKDQAMLFVTCV